MHLGWQLGYPEFYFGEAFTGMHAAAEQEDKTEKSVVTPGPLPPARELLAELLLDLNRPSEALKEFEATLTKEPNRFRPLYGAANQLALFRQAREGQIAAPQKANSRTHRIVPKQQVKFGVQRVTEMKFDNHLLGANLCCKSPKSGLVRVCRSTKGELNSELLRQCLFQANSGLVVEFSVLLDDAVCSGNVLLRERLHPYQKSAAFAVAPRPLFDMLVELSPSAQVKVADAEI